MFSDVFKDYVTHLSFYADSTQLGWTSFLIGSVAYLWQCLSTLVMSLVTFQWLSHVHELPTAFRENYVTLIEGKNVLQAGLMSEPDFYPMLTTDAHDSKNLITGLLNGLFLALPCTLPQIFALRAVILNGWPPAMALASGAAAGTSLYMGIVLFGFDGVIQLMTDWHPLILGLGLVNVAFVASRAALYPDWSEYERMSWDWWLYPHRWDYTSRVVLGRQFRSMMALAFFENHAVGHYFGNLTVTPSPSVLETSDVWWLFDTTGYWLGLTFGMVAWSALVLKVWVWIHPWILWFFRGVVWYKLRFYYHRVTVVGMLVLALHTVPYYGADYLASGPLGLTYQDHLLRIDGAATQMVHLEKNFDTNDEDIEPDEVYTDNISFHDDTLTYFDNGLAITEMLPLEVPVLLPDAYWDQRYIRDESYEEMAKRTNRAMIQSLTTFKRYFSPEKLGYARTMTIGLEDPNDEIVQNANEGGRDDDPDGEGGEDDEDDEDDEVPAIVEEKTYRPEESASGEDYMDALAATVYREDAYTVMIDKYDMEDEDELGAVVRLFRERCLDNAIFKSLLRLDAVPFLGGQPRNHHVNLHDDIALNGQRHALAHYLISLQDYQRDHKVDDYTLAQRVINQQFKGTLTHMRHYEAVRVFYPDPYRDDKVTAKLGNNAMTLVPTDMDVKVLRYDQTLYNRWHDTADGVLHEELMPTYAERQKQPVRERDREAYGMQTYAAGPMYFGWDASARKLLINASRLPVPGDDGGVDGAVESPPYFKFQAYPRELYDDHRQYTFFDLTLDTDREYLDKLRILFGFVLEDEDGETPEWELAKKVRAIHFGEDPAGATDDVIPEQRDILKRLPQYDWAWRRLFLSIFNEEEDNEEFGVRLARRPYFELGQVLPPKLDGVAWPGTIDTSLESRFKRRSTAYFYEYPELLEDPFQETLIESMRETDEAED